MKNKDLLLLAAVGAAAFFFSRKTSITQAAASQTSEAAAPIPQTQPVAYQATQSTYTEMSPGFASKLNEAISEGAAQAVAQSQGIPKWQAEIESYQARLRAAQARGDTYDVQQYSKQIAHFQREQQIWLVHEGAKNIGLDTSAALRLYGLPGTQVIG